MKYLKKAVILGLTITTVGSAVSPVTNVFASEAIEAYNSSKNSIELDKYFNDLSDSKKAEFRELVKGANLSPNEQLQILKEKYDSDREIAPRWKTAVIKKVAKWLAAKAGEKSIADITNYLFEWQDNLEQGAENWLVDHGWNRTAAHWTVKTASFIFL
ncbi:hypothetical protein [Enterococcus faecalis]|jgi:hypothetical protein|uniref:hypothetical protein n=1 Tax=Enterococcus TaxID=1350 RepID=UPI00080C7F74|nr:hypothetical protein [Enterococcus faecalis]ANU71630.1 hypothetical protein A4V06_00485 [Enterococcus faecalis]ARV02463.1 hypothetical protein A6B47_00640 [Enterococcus faecalis]ASU26350.1 hypothetical protein ADH73_09875 [Enterococcus faecalis]EGO8197428.1 hypothetical protein [Enterococcus faecalis]MBG9436843.1 hypothetical protein [Enterococcus faecalis]